MNKVNKSEYMQISIKKELHFSVLLNWWKLAIEKILKVGREPEEFFSKIWIGQVVTFLCQN